MRIIIVDDNLTNQMIIETILKKAGYTDLQIASSAMQLYEMLKIEESGTLEESIDLILMDMMMPEIDGLEACRTILADERYRDVPIIFVTAVGDSNKIAESLDAGATDYVMKPINKLELLARIRSALRLKQEKDWHKERDKRIRYELELAKQVQRSVLSAPIADEQLRIEASYRPSTELAGDYYAWFRIDKNRYGIILLDMMGHGISSSLVCMFISSVLKDMITRIADPEEVVKELNQYMGQLYRADELINYYFTAIFVVIDTEAKTLEYVNAGHPSGLVIQQDQCIRLTSNCPAIGLFEHIKVKKEKLTYEPGAVILLYTDGLLDAMGKSIDTSYHEDAVISYIQAEPMSDPSAIVESLLANSDEATMNDDICMVRITINNLS